MSLPGKVWLWRSYLESDAFQDEWLNKLWIWCLLRANYSEQNYKGRVIYPGQFITGRVSGSVALHVSESKFYRGLQRLEKFGQITLESNNQNTIVTVCNWGTYQNAGDSERTTDEQRMNNQRTTNEQPANTIEEGKKERKKEGNTRMMPPTVEDVMRFCAEQGNGIDAAAFVDYYARQGWKLANGVPMKDWKAAIRTWERRNGKQNNNQPQEVATCRPLTIAELQAWRPTV